MGPSLSLLEMIMSTTPQRTSRRLDLSCNALCLSIGRQTMILNKLNIYCRFYLLIPTFSCLSKGCLEAQCYLLCRIPLIAEESAFPHAHNSWQITKVLRYTWAVYRGWHWGRWTWRYTWFSFCFGRYQCPGLTSSSALWGIFSHWNGEYAVYCLLFNCPWIYLNIKKILRHHFRNAY